MHILIIFFISFFRGEGVIFFLENKLKCLITFEELLCCRPREKRDQPGAPSQAGPPPASLNQGRKAWERGRGSEKGRGFVKWEKLRYAEKKGTNERE